MFRQSLDANGNVDVEMAEYTPRTHVPESKVQYKVRVSIASSYLIIAARPLVDFT